MKTDLSRRLFLGSAIGAAVMAALPVRAMADMINFNFLKKKNTSFPYELTDKEWFDKLGPEGFKVLRAGENETAGTSPLLRETRKGTYACRGCGEAQFASNAKVMANDWPTFRRPINAKNIGTSADFGILLPRTEVHCAKCGSHLGYKFMAQEQQGADQWLYPINGISLEFRPA